MKLVFSVLLMLFEIAIPGNAQRNGLGSPDEERTLCFVCNSLYDPKCGDPFDNSTISTVDCKQMMPPHLNVTFFCRKTVQTVSLDTRIDHRVIRSCGYIPETRLSSGKADDQDVKTCYSKAGTSNIKLTYCACHSNGCNSAPTQVRCPLCFANQIGIQIAGMIAASYFMLKDRCGF